MMHSLRAYGEVKESLLQDGSQVTRRDMWRYANLNGQAPKDGGHATGNVLMIGKSRNELEDELYGN